mmetsp:Transcript_17980/g.53279  ORF Transcript_17980/g.53279 Transcript_17980/m.53279 type:complete len:251 (+) Transcript_17980:104-856(+)
MPPFLPVFPVVLAVVFRRGCPLPPTPAVRHHSPQATAGPSADDADSMLVRATEALRKGELEEAGRLTSAARSAFPVGSEKYALAEMIQERIDAAAAVPLAEDSPLTASEMRSVARKAASNAVAAKLAAKSGPVAWSPQPESPEQVAAMKEGDQALSRTVAQMGAKDFAAAFESLEQARAAFAAAGEDVAQARGAAVDNLYGYLIAERERDGKLQKLVRMKQILARKKSLEDEGADRIARALSRERDDGQA